MKIKSYFKDVDMWVGVYRDKKNKKLYICPLPCWVIELSFYRPVYDNIEFSVECSMNKRWVSNFLGVLKSMQYLGSIGGSRRVTIYSDGDGDFRPKFLWPDDLPEPAEPIKNENGNVTYDAG